LPLRPTSSPAIKSYTHSSRAHAPRHGYALSYLLGGGTLGRLQQLLGHEDIATTSRYLAAVDERAAPAPKDPWARS
jgi:site-specific recombinase XerD